MVDPRLTVPPGEWRVVDAAGFRLRVTSRDGQPLFRATDVAAAGSVCVANGSTLRGLSPGDAVYVPRAAVGLTSQGRAVPFLTADGARKLLRRSRTPGAFVLESWLIHVAVPAPSPAHA